MSKEYRVVYTIDGNGYRPGEPWIDTVATDDKKALHELEELEKHIAFFPNPKAWIEVREVGEWTTWYQHLES